MITTSYMGNWRKYENYVPVCIMRWKPKYFNGVWFPSLAPYSENLAAYKDGKISFETFHREMVTQLEKLNSKEILNQLNQLGDNVVLLCTCKDYDHCHRKIVAEWFSRKLNIEVKEI